MLTLSLSSFPPLSLLSRPFQGYGGEEEGGSGDGREDGRGGESGGSGGTLIGCLVEFIEEFNRLVRGV